MRKPVLITVICFCCAITFASAQTSQPDISFGSVKPEDFAPAAYAIDSSAEAVYLFDVGSAYFHENGESHFELVHSRHARIRILSLNAFDLATLVLTLDNTDDSKETLTSMDAAVYNLVNGKIASEQIDKKSVFTEKSKEETKVKLTLPKVSVGSIIEFSYIITQPPGDLPDWSFQGHYPRLWSRYEVVIPYLFNFAVLKQGNLSFVVDSTSTFHTDYSYGHYRMNEENTLQHTWVMKNVPGIAPEPYIGTINNYAAKIEFQLSAYADAYGNYTAVNQNWTSVCMKLMGSPSFGFSDEKDKKSLNAIVKTVCAQDTIQLEKAKHIYRYVRDHYTCLYHTGKIRSQEVKTTLQSRKGSLADINLLLFALLEEAGLTVHPVLLSTASHGKIVYEYPTFFRYNYIICQLIVDKKQYLLDAGCNYLPFDGLTDQCYNGYSRVISVPGSQGIFISPNSLVDSVCTNIKINRGESKAQVTTTLGIQPSIESKTHNDDEEKKDQSGILKNILNSDAAVMDVKEKGFSDADSNVTFTYQIPLEALETDVVYFSPLLSLQMKSNPFTAASRAYEIEMPFCRKDVFHADIEIPDGYEVEDMPKPEVIKADSVSGELTYAIVTKNNHVLIDVQAKIGRAVYQPEEYNSLRKFYSDVLAKETQQIVFKKKK